jgi:hypothetical protein
VVPKVVVNLRSNVLPKYQAVPLYIRRKNGHGPWFRDELGDYGRYPDVVLWKNLTRYDRHSAIRNLQKELLQWGQELNLTDQWLLDGALYTLYRWARNPTGAFLRDPAAWNRLSQVPYEDESRGFSSKEQEFRFESDGWYADQETWNDFKNRVTKQFGEKLAHYELYMEKLATTRDLVRPIDIRYPNHYEWLARYQSGDLTLNGLASRIRQKENTVLKAVQRAATRIGLTLRPGKSMTKHPR